MRVMIDPADTGPVTLALPQDVQAHAYDYPAYFFERREWRVERRVPDPSRIAEAVALLKAAQRPMIIAGGGVHYSEAWDELAAFSETFGIPVSETFAGKGAIRNASPLLVGGQGVTGTPVAGKISSQADLVISVGTRLGDFATGSRSIFNHPEVKFININVGTYDAYKQGALPIIADAREALRALTRGAEAAGIQPSSAYVQEVAELNTEWEGQLKEEIYQYTPDEAMSQGQLIRVINDEAQSGDTIIGAAGTPPGDLLKIWDATGGRACHMEFGYSCMGYEIPAGLGVRMSQPAGEVYVFIGDGTYLMNPTELVTSMQENLKLTVVISENHGFQSIRALQMLRAGRSFGNEFRSRDVEANLLEGSYLKIDFAQNAASFGARSWHVTTPEGVRHALREARGEPRTCVIVAEVEPHHYLPDSGVWWDIAAAETSEDPVTQERRKEYEEGLGLQRLHY
jgi:3D-(3,5/4)-trihydroxycyclohexane-1,2-dione acylhydrolase (decyclizing)